jgi:hypothetical protein
MSCATYSFTLPNQHLALLLVCNSEHSQPVAGAGRPSSLLAVATSTSELLTLLFKTVCMHAFIPLLFPICAALTCHLKKIYLQMNPACTPTCGDGPVYHCLRNYPLHRTEVRRERTEKSSVSDHDIIDPLYHSQASIYQ